MPITEAEMTYEDMKRATEDGHTCTCGGRLNIATLKGKTVLRCGNSLEHNKITRHDKEYEAKMTTATMDSTALTKLNIGQMTVRIAQAKFPQQLNAMEARTLARAAIDYGFDPLMGEISLYQGRPYVSIDGRYRKAQETGLLNGVDSRPATKEERQAQQIPDTDYLYRAEVHVKGADYPFVGWGRVFASEMAGGKGFKPVEKNPQRMAEKRAEAQALRKAFHINLPSIEFAGTPDDNAIESTARVIEEQHNDRKADVIGNSDHVDEAEMQASEAIEDKPLTLGEVLNWCVENGKKNGKKYDKAWFLKNCGVPESELIIPARLEYAMSNIATLTGWEGLKRGV